jgi:hypothetical protein
MPEYNLTELETYGGINEKLYEGTVHNDAVDGKDEPVDVNIFKQGTFFLKVSAFAAQSYTAATIAFVSASHKITDSANGLAGFLTGDKIEVSGSVANDGIYTIATGGVAGEIVVSEALVDGVTGPSVTIEEVDVKLVADTIAFVLATKKITDSGNGLADFLTGDKIRVGGSTSNDGIYTIATGGVAGEIVVTEALVNEGAGATVTIETVKKLDVKVQSYDPITATWFDLVSFTSIVGEVSTERKAVTANLGHKIAAVVTPSTWGPEQITLKVGANFQIM